MLLNPATVGCHRCSPGRSVARLILCTIALVHCTIAVPTAAAQEPVEEAKRALRKLLEYPPEESSCRPAEFLKESEAVLEKLAGQPIDDARFLLHLRRGDVYYFIKNYPATKSEYEQCVKIRPDSKRDAALAWRLTRIQARVNPGLDPEGVIAKWVEQHPEHLPGTCSYVTLLVSRGKYEKALSVIAEFEKARPLPPELRYRRAVVYYYTKAFEKCLSDLNLVLREHPILEEIPLKSPYQLYAQACLRSKRYEEALRYILLARQLNPTELDIQKVLFPIAWASDRYPIASDIADRLLQQLGEKDLPTRFLLMCVESYLGTRQLDKANRLSLSMATSHPDDANALFARGWVLFHEHKARESLKMLSRSLELDNKNEHPKRLLAALHLLEDPACNNPERSIALLSELSPETKQEPFIEYLFAVAYSQTKDFDKSREHLKRAKSGFGNDAQKLKACESVESALEARTPWYLKYTIIYPDAFVP